MNRNVYLSEVQLSLGEEYKLFWPEQPEFVRMASRFGAKIIPFGVVGEDDVCDVSVSLSANRHRLISDLSVVTLLVHLFL
jgi:hypothetical protein